VEGLCTINAEFETTPKSGSVGPGSVEYALAIPPKHTLKAGVAQQSAQRPRARVHWYVYAEMVYVCYQLTWAVYFWRLGRHGPAGEHAFLGFAVGGLCCFYGDDASTWGIRRAWIAPAVLRLRQRGIQAAVVAGDSVDALAPFRAPLLNRANGV